MKPEQFIREFGVEKAREVGRLVASITAIKELGGIDAAKALQRRAKYSWFWRDCSITKTKASHPRPRINIRRRG